MALVLALVASLSWGIGDFVGGFTSRRIHVLTVLAISLGAGLVLAATVALVSRDPAPSLGSVVVAMGAGAAGAIGLGAMYRGMAVGAMGVVAPISGVAAVVPFSVGLSEGERPSLPQIVGVVAALAGIVLVSREPSRGGARRAAGVGLALLAAAGFGLYFVLTDVAANRMGVPWTVVSSRGAATVLALGAALALHVPLRTGGRVLPLVIAAGLFDSGANLLYSLATTRGLVSVVAVLSSLFPVVTVGLARLLLGERLARPQWAGAAAALAGAALITAG